MLTSIAESEGHRLPLALLPIIRGKQVNIPEKQATHASKKSTTISVKKAQFWGFLCSRTTLVRTSPGCTATISMPTFVGSFR